MSRGNLKNGFRCPAYGTAEGCGNQYYEDLGNSIYQVYVDEAGGEIVPFVTVDSATGDYHG